MDQAPNRQIRYTAAGELIEFRPAASVRIGRTITSIIRLSLAGAFAYATYPAVRAYLETGEISGALLYLESFELSARWLYAIVLAWCGLLAWWTIASVYELLKIHLQRDQFLIRSDGLIVRRGSFIPRELQFKAYEPLELRLRPLDGALEAKNNLRASILTDGGSVEDREWLMDLLQQRYRFPKIPIGTTTIESVATYRVERRPDQSVLITSSAASRFGCAALAVLACVILLSVSVWIFLKGSLAGVIPLMFFVVLAFAGLTTLNQRSVEASSGRLSVKWRSPAGALLKRFSSSRNQRNGHPFGEGEYQRHDGTFTLKTSRRPKGEPVYQIIIGKRAAEEEDIESFEEETETDELDLELQDEIEIGQTIVDEELVLEFSGSTSRPAAEYILNLLSETTGFTTEHY
jgi:hypothetical protein